MNPQQKPEYPLQKRALLYMEKEAIPTQVKTLVENAFAKFLQDEPVVLTRNEKERLYKTIVEQIFDTVLANL